MKKALSVILSLVMISSMFALGSVTSAASDTYGRCGDNLRWSYSEFDNCLSISGEGPMYDYTYSNGTGNRPWEKFADEIQSILINNATHIGNYAFAGLKKIRGATFMMNTVLTIGEGAFQDCTSIYSIHLCENLVAIGPSAFKGCSNLQRITLDKKTIYIGNDAFEGCPIRYTIYNGTPEQKDLIVFEDKTEGLSNVFYGSTEYDISVQINEYQVLTAISDRPFTFTVKDKKVAEIIESEYGNVEENGVAYFYGAVAVLGKSDGTTTVFAVDEENTVIGAFSVIAGKCAHTHYMVEWETIDESTCSYSGFEVNKCAYCSQQNVNYLSYEPHDNIVEYIVEPTCNTGGIRHTTCKVCGYEKTQEVPRTDIHNWSEWSITVPPTESSDGERERHCVECGRLQKETIPPISTLVGDVNCDGKVTAFDARMALQCAAGNIELDEHQLKLADVTGDGEITAIDARKILQIAATSV